MEVGQVLLLGIQVHVLQGVDVVAEIVADNAHLLHMLQHLVVALPLAVYQFFSKTQFLLGLSPGHNAGGTAQYHHIQNQYHDAEGEIENDILEAPQGQHGGGENGGGSVQNNPQGGGRIAQKQQAGTAGQLGEKALCHLFQPKADEQIDTAGRQKGYNDAHLKRGQISGAPQDPGGKRIQRI